MSSSTASKATALPWMSDTNATLTACTLNRGRTGSASREPLRGRRSTQLDRWLTARRPLSLVAATVAVWSGGFLREAGRGGEPDDTTGLRRCGREAAVAGRKGGTGAEVGGVAEAEDA